MDTGSLYIEEIWGDGDLGGWKGRKVLIIAKAAHAQILTGSSQSDVDRLTDRHTDKLTTVPRACVLRQIDKNKTQLC